MGDHDDHDGRCRDLISAVEHLTVDRMTVEQWFVGAGEGFGGGFLNSHDDGRGYRPHRRIPATPEYALGMPAARATDPVEELSQATKDIAHIGIGLAVLALQKAQVQRRAIERAFDDAGLDPRVGLQRVLRCATDLR
jgi:hypothetical protein